MYEHWDWSFLESWAGKLSAITMILATALGTYKAIKAGIVKLMNVVNKIYQISDELSENKKGNLRDMISQIEDRQIRLEERKKVFFHTHPSVLYELNENLDLIWCNRAFLEEFDVDSDTVVDQRWYNLIAEQDRSRIEQLFQDAKHGSRDLTTKCKFYIGEGEQRQEKEGLLLATVFLNKAKICSGFLVNIKLKSA
jgi:PAS domain-containing protein